jgi:predicted nucleic acid-binding Zn ribbon protein
VKTTPRKPLNAVQRRVLTEWRGIEEPLDLTRHEHQLAELLARVIRKAGLEARHAEEDLAPAWEAAVGEFVAQHSRAISFENGVLHVAVLQPSIRFTLQRELKSRILPKLKSALPGHTIRDVKFRLS